MATAAAVADSGRDAQAEDSGAFLHAYRQQLMKELAEVDRRLQDSAVTAR